MVEQVFPRYGNAVERTQPLSRPQPRGCRLGRRPGTGFSEADKHGAVACFPDAAQTGFKQGNGIGCAGFECGVPIGKGKQGRIHGCSSHCLVTVYS
ncbi:hypothetical protein [Neisseria canis]|uniref:hypothetical protein n=1 Tax=Neisseria canis TaxID=493 RepID=UPI0018D52FC7|nr:hypothetical protein [Neisseria canis]